MGFVFFVALVSLFCVDLLLCEGNAFRSIACTSCFVLFLFLNYCIRDESILRNPSDLLVSVLMHSVLPLLIVLVHLSGIFPFSEFSHSLLLNSRSSFPSFVLLEPWLIV